MFAIRMNDAEWPLLMSLLPAVIRAPRHRTTKIRHGSMTNMRSTRLTACVVHFSNIFVVLMDFDADRPVDRLAG